MISSKLWWFCTYTTSGRETDRSTYVWTSTAGGWSFYCTCQHLVELLISAWALSSENAFKPPKIPLHPHTDCRGVLYKSDKEIKMTNLIHVNLPPTVCFCGSVNVWVQNKTAECDFCGKILRNRKFILRIIISSTSKNGEMAKIDWSKMAKIAKITF